VPLRILKDNTQPVGKDSPKVTGNKEGGMEGGKKEVGKIGR
jgi:hypothetical protein